MATLRGFERDDFIWVGLSHLGENKTQKECKNELRRSGQSNRIILNKREDNK
jgi:hypothetical protein